MQLIVGNCLTFKYMLLLIDLIGQLKYISVSVFLILAHNTERPPPATGDPPKPVVRTVGIFFP